MATKHNEARRPDELRIILIGKTGAGKSSAGNTILGREAFEANLKLVTSSCKKAKGDVGGQGVAVINTLGLFGTTYSNEQVLRKIKLCIGMSSPGPHAFLVVVQLGRFTKEEKQTVKMIQQTFGKAAADYTMVLFTHGDKLKKKSIEEFVSKSPDLEELVQKCKGRYHVFNNEAENPSQVSELLEKIRVMINDNGGSYYTPEMYKKAEEEIEKKQQILKESGAEKKKALEELTAKFTFSGQMKEMQKQMLNMRRDAEPRAEAEASNWAAALARSEANAQANTKAFTEALAKAEDTTKANTKAWAEALAQSQDNTKALAEALAQSQDNTKALAEALAQSQDNAKASAEALAKPKDNAKASAEALAQCEAKKEDGCVIL